MAFWDGLLGGGGSDPLDIYGDLFSEKQKAALAQRSASEGLLRMAGAFGAAAQPSRMPTSFLGSLGQAAGAMAGHGDETAKTALSGMKVAEDVRASRQRRELIAKATPIVQALIAAGIDPNSPIGRQALVAAGVPAGAGSAAAPGAPAAPGAGGGGPNAPPPPPGAPPGMTTSATAADAAGPPPEIGSASGALPALLPIPPAPPGGRITPADYGVPGAPQQNTGLLPPQDQMVGPDGQPLQGSGILPTMNASYGGAPGGMPPFRRVSSTPTSAATPGADDWQRVRPLIRKYESGGRNVEQGVVGPEGGYNPSVGRVTGPSSASGYYQMIDPTWRAAARKVGIDTDKYPRAIDAPEELQDKAAEALYREQGLRPWAPYNKALAAATGYQGGGQDTVIPSGRGIPRSALTNVADTGAAPGAPAGGGGYIPGLGITPQGLGALNALLEMGGVDSPFKSVLDTYYKSPGYLEEAAGATEKGKDPYVRGQARFTSDLTLGREMITRGVVLNPDGSLGVRPGAEALSAAENAKFTNDIKEYNFYAQQEKERGGLPKPFGIWDQERKKAGATTINTAEGMEAAQTKARIGVDTKIATEVAEQAIAGRRLLPVLDELAYLADKTPEGWRGTVAPTIGRAMAGLGMSVPAEMSNAEAFQALAQRLVPIVREPGATSQGEMSIYLQAGPQLAGTTEGRKKLIAMNKAMVERSQEIARVYRDNIGSPQLYEKLSALDRPLFTDEQRAALNAAATPAAAPAAPAQPPPTGGSTPLPGGGAEAPIPPPIGTIRKGYEFLGGDPSSSSSWRKAP